MSDVNSPKKSVEALEVSNKPVVWGVHLIVTVIIFIVAFSIIAAMFTSKPSVRKWGGGPPASVGVETVKLTASNYPVWIESYGSAEPLTQTQLVAEVNGRVIEVANNIRAGASFKAGDVLLSIDPRDYQIEVDVAKSTVADAWVKYKEELAQADVAEQDWNIQPGNDAGRDLALRKPQVAAALASFDASKARLAKAKLNLERTQVKAPFDGKILKQMVDLGQVVNPSQTIAEIYSTDFIEVRLPVKAQDLAHIQLPDDYHTPGNTPINNRENLPIVLFEGELGGKTYTWEGKLVRNEGAFDSSTRMLYVVAKLDNPFVSSEQLPALRVGQFLRAKIEGTQLTNVYAIPRRAVSQSNMVAVAEEGVLQKRLIAPLWTDKDSVVISASPQAGTINNYNKVLNSTDQLILTPTANLAAGTRVRSLNDVNANEQLATNKSLIFPVKKDTKPSDNSPVTLPAVNKAAANSSTPTQN
ncbi:MULTISPECIES: efflux RND transporter periplasmic adaptor subunit [unclassified Colwellia]|uniref:efflux RND transporter periplasmic adaptor subunit n=1 Tax=unclassified Colwellia TaxID=196834 RepID=UPI0015F77697|nr:MULTISPECIES: efflux RND transporter periplasmic adaptor subunit [unclassified Colwellia]MBA6255260.1 efflux RND transporter periplasmic adaptor subunit [Colwellia sp. MB3u-28]MBA6258575.1 efflux RND transporter periplasmic adaptor subunit [Colwellia sp. MB3u-41]MBA6302595.1 efflux RND transporter periplasmic adaptor subunit [Colwellia sp. MB02u-14]